MERLKGKSGNLAENSMSPNPGIAQQQRPSPELGLSQWSAYLHVYPQNGIIKDCFLSWQATMSHLRGDYILQLPYS